MLPIIGYKDMPIAEVNQDILEVMQYVESLSEFILECDTPMTIAIQGDWGSGKTSIMNLVRKHIELNTFSIWFNTWQYSQFEMQSYLTISLLGSFLEQLGSDDKTKTMLQKISKGLTGVTDVVKGIAKSVTVGYAEKYLGETIAGNINEHIGPSPVDIAKEITSLKAQIEQAVNKKLVTSGKSRVVVFIDDLDRLMPEKAVELLEVLKLFMDVDNCVFVLAVDYGVVVKGLEKKFGEKIGHMKGKSFFDKIIQLPFTVPMAQYKVDKYVKVFLERMKITFTEADVSTYCDLINSSIGFNPRSVKRLFNSYLLLNKVANKKNILEGNNMADKQRVLFAVLCMQMAFDIVYDYLLKNFNDITSELLDDFSDIEKLRLDLNFIQIRNEIGADDLNLQKLTNFMSAFKDALQLDDDDSLSEVEIDNLKQILSFSSITATSQEHTSINSAEKLQKTSFSNLDEFQESLAASILSKDTVELSRYIYESIHQELDDDVQSKLTITFASFKNKSVIYYRNDSVKSRDKNAFAIFIKNEQCYVEFRNSSVSMGFQNFDTLVITSDKWANIKINSKDYFDQNKDLIIKTLRAGYESML